MASEAILEAVAARVEQAPTSVVPELPSPLSLILPHTIAVENGLFDNASIIVRSLSQAYIEGETLSTMPSGPLHGKASLTRAGIGGQLELDHLLSPDTLPVVEMTPVSASDCGVWEQEASLLCALYHRTHIHIVSLSLSLSLSLPLSLSLSLSLFSLLSSGFLHFCIALLSFTSSLLFFPLILPPFSGINLPPVSLIALPYIPPNKREIAYIRAVPHFSLSILSIFRQPPLRSLPAVTLLLLRLWGS